jgi:hypothetical protein
MIADWRIARPRARATQPRARLTQSSPSARRASRGSSSLEFEIAGGLPDVACRAVQASRGVGIGGLTAEDAAPRPHLVLLMPRVGLTMRARFGSLLLATHFVLLRSTDGITDLQEQPSALGRPLRGDLISTARISASEVRRKSVRLTDRTCHCQRAFTHGDGSRGGHDARLGAGGPSIGALGGTGTRPVIRQPPGCALALNDAFRESPSLRRDSSAGFRQARPLVMMYCFFGAVLHLR